MRLLQLPTIITAFTFAALSLMSPPLDAADEKARNAGPGAGDLCNELGNVKYAAKWTAGKVTLTAEGKHNTGGYGVSFQQSQLKIFPPQFSLVHKKPHGFVTQAITPFTASTSFEASEKPKEIVVRDARGEQRVAVE